MLGLSHVKIYGAVFIGSHGASNKHEYDFNATIEPALPELDVDLRHLPEQVQVEAAMGFARFVEASLPHITVSPLPLGTYIQNLQAVFQSLVRDSK